MRFAVYILLMGVFSIAYLNIPTIEEPRSKQLKQRRKRWKNWKRRHKKQKQLQTLLTQNRTKYFGYPIVDGYQSPTKVGNLIAKQLQYVIDKCLQFYEIGIKEDMLRLETEKCAMVLGKVNDNYSDLFMPDRQGFVYYNEALEDLPLIFNTGSSISVTPDYKEFIMYEEVQGQGLSNITGESQVQGKGLVKWEMLDYKGKAHKIIVEAYFVPTARVRLFSVQSHLSRHDGIFFGRR